MTKPSFVGAVDADQKRPQVFHNAYLPMEPGRRTLGTTTDPKPWCVSVNSQTKKQFRTHAKAIRYAHKIARKGKRGSKT
jgi:hypothetical protein